MKPKTKNYKLRYSLIIPVYNSKRILEQNCLVLQNEFKKLGQPFEILYCSDCSPDKPLSLMRQLAKKYANVRVFEHHPNRGLGYTMRQLFAKSQGEFVIYMDADTYFTTNLTQLPHLLSYLGKYDVVVGNRYIWKENEIPLARIAASHAFNLVNRFLLGIKVEDTGSGLAIYRKSMLDKISLRSERFEIHAELYARLRKAGAKTIEVPVEYRHWSGGSFKLFQHGWETLERMFKVWGYLRE